MRPLPNVWVLRAKPSDVPSVDKFLEGGLIGIGWPDIGSMEGMTDSEIEKAYEEAYSDNEELQRKPMKKAIHKGQLKDFARHMQVGDIVLVPDVATVHVGTIESPYYYVADDPVCPHRRRVRWLTGKTGIPRERLHQKLRDSMRSQLTVFQPGLARDVGLALLAESIPELAERGKPVAATPEQAAESSPTRQQAPDDAAEADSHPAALASVIDSEVQAKARRQLLQELESPDPDRRLKAIELVLRYGSAR